MPHNYLCRGLCLAGLLFSLAWAPAFGRAAPSEPSATAVTAPYIIAQNDWNNLSEQEQRLLKDHRQKWNSYPPDYRSRLRQGAERYQNLSPEERERLQRSRERYKNLSPQEREQLKRQYRENQER
jgi:hypothetical protein